MKNKKLTLEICEDCGNTFMAGGAEHFCRDCRRIRLSEAAKKRNLNRLGVEARWGKKA